MLVRPNHVCRRNTDCGGSVRRCMSSLLGMVCLLFQLAPIPVANAQTNIVHIFADDLGWGSVGFNGQSLIQTPNLDSLAAGGLKFENAYAATVCGPARAMLYSGYHNGHTLVDRNSNLNGTAFRTDGETVGDYLQAAGYRTAMFGKGGFGGTSSSGALRPNPIVDDPDSLPINQGFETFYGYIDHGRAHSYQVDSLWTTEEPFDDNGNGIDEVGEKYQPTADNGLWLEKTGNNASNTNANHTSDLVTMKAVEYIEAHANGEQPFYLQYASTIPHFDIDSIRNIPGWFDDYVDPNTGLDTVPGAGSWTNKQKSYAAMITRLDSQVGELVAKLSDPDGDPNTDDSVMQDTLIMFTSDNGATAEDSSPITFFDASGGKRGGKRDLWDGGINVPTFAYWEGTIAGGQTSQLYTDLSDFLPTALELAGIEGRVGLDGVSILHELNGQGLGRKKDYLVQEHHENDGPDPDGKNGRWAIIKDDHKLIKYSDGTLRLYNLVSDPDENNELDLVSNAAMVDEFTAIAIAEGAEESDSYTVEFQDWVGGNGDDFNDPNNWAGTASAPQGPRIYWSGVINNSGGTESIVASHEDAIFLGLEVKGDGARQTVRPNRYTTLTGRNEIRISAGGRINLDQASLATVRWVDVKTGGELTGHGEVQGDVYNWGIVAPGLPADLPQPEDLLSPPPGVDTGVVSALVFDFSEIQDDAPLTQTSTLSQYLQLTQGLDFSGATTPRHTTKPGSSDVGDEFNVSNWGTGTSLTNAISGSRYIGFSVEPVFGIEMLVDTVSFNLWRNGVNAPKDYAIMTSLDPFVAGNEIVLLEDFTDESIANDHLLVGTYTGSQWTTDEVEIRLYGWDANQSAGNTHVNAVSMTASFRTVSGGGDPNVALNPTGELTLNGDFFHIDGGLIEMELGGTSLLDPLDPEYDRLIVSGAVDLAGNLTVALVDGFNPALNDTFDLFDFGSLTGAFNFVNLPSLDPGLEWDTSNLLVDGTISVAVYDADYNDNGLVDGLDLLAWQVGDSPNPGSQFDLTLWESQYGSTVPLSSSTAVPEPSGFLLTLGLVAFVARSRSGG